MIVEKYFDGCLRSAVTQANRMLYNDGFKRGIVDELDRVPVPIDIPLKGYDFYLGYHAARRWIKKLRSTD